MLQFLYMHPEIEAVVEQIKKEENVINKAKLLRFLTVDKEMRIKDISGLIGMKESYICHILRLNKLSDMIVDGYYSKMISISHLFIISRLHSDADIATAYEKILSDNLTVGQTEELVREVLYKTKTVGDHIPKDEAAKMSRTVSTLFEGVTLKIIQTRIKSRAVFEIKGSLAQTTLALKKLIDRLTS